MPIVWSNFRRDGASWRGARVVDRCFMPASFQMPAALPRRSFGLIARFSKTPQEEERRPCLARVILAARIGGEPNAGNHIGDSVVAVRHQSWSRVRRRPVRTPNRRLSVDYLFGGLRPSV